MMAVGDDVAWTWMADDLVNPINTFALGSDSYSVLPSRTDMDGVKQQRIMSRLSRMR